MRRPAARCARPATRRPSPRTRAAAPCPQPRSRRSSAAVGHHQGPPGHRPPQSVKWRRAAA